MKISKWIWILIGIIITANIAIYVTRAGGDDFLVMAGDLFPVACSLLAVIGLFSSFSSFKYFDQAKIAWLIMLIGTALFLAGESTYFILEVVMKTNMDEVFPSIADIFWFVGYPPLIAGLIVLIAGYMTSGLPLGRLKLYLASISIIFIVFACSLVVLLFIPIIEDPETTPLAKFSYLFYPVGDLFLIFPAACLAYITSLFGTGLFSKPWKYISVGFIIMTTADIIYSYLGWNNQYQTGNPIDIAWNCSYLLLALGGFYQNKVVKSV